MLRTLTHFFLSLVVMISMLVAIGLAMALPAPTSALSLARSYTYPGQAPCNTTLQDCINGLHDGDAIHILPGEYTVSLSLNKGISLIGNNPLSPTVLRGVNGQRVLTISGATVNSSVVISGLQISGGNVAIGSQYPDHVGGGIFIFDGAWPTLNNLVVSDNRAYDGSGIYIDQTGQAQGAVMIVHSQIVDNQAFDRGGGLYLSKGSVTFSGDSKLSNNTAFDAGGGVYIDRGTFTLQSGQITGNHAITGNGGGLYLNNPTAIYTQLAGELSQNTAGSGGGLYAENNLVQLYGGSVFSNAATGNGGGLYLAKGNLVLNDPVQIVGNRAANGGGLYFNAGTAQLLGGRLITNVASGSGGGLYASNTITINATRFLANSAGNFGGGLYSTDNGDVSVTNALFARNTSGQAAAALSLNSGGTTLLRHLTIAAPISNAVEAIVVAGGTTDIRDTIVTSHTVGIRRIAGILTADYNLYFGNGVNHSGFTSGAHDVIDQDPLFTNPAPGVDNYRLQLFSPAVDAGVNVGVHTDLSGWLRPIGNGFDIGTFELQADAANIGPTAGGTLNYTSTTGTTATVLLPPGLVNLPTVVVFNNLVDTTTTPIPALPPHLSLSGNVFDVDAFVNNSQVVGITFTHPVTIVFHYNQADVIGLLNGALKLYRYEHPPYGNGWCAIGQCRPSEGQWLDLNHQTLTVRIMGFSRFGRMGVTAETDVFLPLLIRGN